LHDVESALGKSPEKFSDDWSSQPGLQQGWCTECNNPARSGYFRSHFIFHELRATKNAVYVIVQTETRLSQANATSMSEEYELTDVLKPRNGSAEGRLGDAQVIGSAHEAASVSDFLEIT
jgi:hypothetical protein